MGGRAQSLSYWGDKNILSLDYGGGYTTKSHQVVHLKRVNFTMTIDTLID